MTISMKVADVEITNKVVPSDQIEFGNIPELSQSISFESALFGLLTIIKDKKNDIEISDSSIKVPGNQKEILNKISFCMEILCNIPFSFEYNIRTDTYSCNFTHLLPEISSFLS